MNQAQLIKRVNRLLSLGIDPAKADPTLDVWSNGERGKLHVDQHCYKIDLGKRVHSRINLSSTGHTKLCSECYRTVILLHRPLKSLLGFATVTEQIETLISLLRDGDASSKVQARSALVKLSESYDTKTESLTRRDNVIEVVRGLLDEAIAEAQAACSAPNVEKDLLRIVALQLLVDGRTEDVLCDQADAALFGGQRAKGNLNDLFATWKNSYTTTGDAQAALRDTVVTFKETTTPSSWSQLNFEVADIEAPTGNFSTWSRSVWRAHAEKTLRRLCDEWTNKVETYTMDTERDHAVVFTVRRKPMEHMAAVTDQYKVAQRENTYAIRCPRAVAIWLQQESVRLWQFHDVVAVEGPLDDVVLETVVTLYDNGSGTYANLEEALTSAKLL
jgi:hypothetical protein